MTNTGKELEAIVASIERSLLSDDFNVELNRRVIDKDGVQEAEFDIVISGRVGSAPYKCLIECRDRRSQSSAPGSWILEVIGKRDAYGFNNAMAVSSTGFSPAAKRHAIRYGIELRQLETIQSGVEAWFPVPKPCRVLRRVLKIVNFGFAYTDPSAISLAQQRILKNALEGVSSMKDSPLITENRLKWKKGVNSIQGLFKYMADGTYFQSIELAFGETHTEEITFDLSSFDGSICFETDSGLVPVEIATVGIELHWEEEEIPISQIRQYKTQNGKPLVQRIEVSVEGAWETFGLPFTTPNVEGHETVQASITTEFEDDKVVINISYEYS